MLRSIVRRSYHVGLLTLLWTCVLLNYGCALFAQEAKQAPPAPPIQTILLKTGVTRVKLIDQQHEREIEIAWNSDQLGKLEEQQTTAEIVRLPATKGNGAIAQAPVSVVVFNRKPDRSSKSFQRPEAVSIRQVAIKDGKGFFVNPGDDGQYRLKPGETVRVELVLDNPSNQPVVVDLLSRTGQIVADSTYLAPAKSGETDQVKIKVFHTHTGALLDMDMIAVKVVDLD